MPTFQNGDIVKDGNSFIKIFTAFNGVVFRSIGWDSREIVSASQQVFATPISETSSWQIVERDGKPYVEKPWEPVYGKKYWRVEVTSGLANAIENEWLDLDWQRTQFNVGILFQTKEEAIAAAQKMLDVLNE